VRLTIEYSPFQSFLFFFLFLYYSCEANGSKFAGVEGRNLLFQHKRRGTGVPKISINARSRSQDNKSKKENLVFDRRWTTRPNKASRMVIALE